MTGEMIRSISMGWKFQFWLTVHIWLFLRPTVIFSLEIKLLQKKLKINFHGQNAQNLF